MRKAKALHEKQQISQPFMMQSAIMKGRYKTYILGFSMALKQCLSARFFTPEDSGFLAKTTHWNPPIELEQNGRDPFVRLSDERAEKTQSRSSNEWLPLE